jgi:hypothetical protein
MLICPYCEQDDVWEVRLNDLERNAVICLECETVWPSPNAERNIMRTFT